MAEPPHQTGEVESESLRRIEFATGMAAGLLGVLGLAYATLGPIYQSSTGTTASLVEVNGPQVVVVILGLLALVAAIGAGSYLHAHQGRGAGLALLWVGAVMLAMARVIMGFSIGVFIQPAAALGLISAVAGSMASRHPWRYTAGGVALFWAASSLLYFAALATGELPDRAGQAVVFGPLAALAWLFDPRQLAPLLG